MEAGDNKTLFCNVSDDKILAACPRLNSYFDFLLLRWPRSPDQPSLLVLQLVSSAPVVCCKTETEYELALASWVREIGGAQRADECKGFAPVSNDYVDKEREFGQVLRMQVQADATPRVRLRPPLPPAAHIRGRWQPTSTNPRTTGHAHRRDTTRTSGCARSTSSARAISTSIRSRKCVSRSRIVRVTDAVHVSIHTISHNLYITVLFPPAASAIFLQKVTGLRPPSFVDAEEERRRARRCAALPSATDDVGE